MVPSTPNDPYFPRLIEQRDSRRQALARQKKTVMEFSAQIEETLNGNGTMPPPPSELPPQAYSIAAADLEESSEEGGLATNVLSPGSIEHDPIADGFAALRAQRAQRKAGLRELRRTVANTACAQQRTRYIPPLAVEKLRAEFREEESARESDSD